MLVATINATRLTPPSARCRMKFSGGRGRGGRGRRGTPSLQRVRGWGEPLHSEVAVGWLRLVGWPVEARWLVGCDVSRLVGWLIDFDCAACRGGHMEVREDLPFTP